MSTEQTAALVARRLEAIRSGGIESAGAGNSVVSL